MNIESFPDLLEVCLCFRTKELIESENALSFIVFRYTLVNQVTPVSSRLLLRNVAGTELSETRYTPLNYRYALNTFKHAFIVLRSLDLLVLLNDELKVSSRASISTRAEHPLMLVDLLVLLGDGFKVNPRCFNIYESRTDLHICCLNYYESRTLLCFASASSCRFALECFVLHKTYFVSLNASLHMKSLSITRSPYFDACLRFGYDLRTL